MHANADFADHLSPGFALVIHLLDGSLHGNGGADGFGVLIVVVLRAAEHG